MSKDSEQIAAMREEYGNRELRRADLANEPVEQFTRWFDEACQAKLPEPNAMTLATIRADQFPATRTVLMKAYDAQGFVFFTNYNSDKAKEILSTSKASLLFPWILLERQVRIDGVVEKVSDEESADYFAKRPRESQLGAWASDQSSAIDSRELLLKQLDELRKEHEGKDIPRPPFWGGFRVRPVRFEFWQGGKGRVHDRFRYTKHDNSWDIERLSP